MSWARKRAGGAKPPAIIASRRPTLRRSLLIRMWRGGWCGLYGLCGLMPLLHELLDGHRGDAGQRRLCHRIAQNLTHATAASAATSAAEQLPEQPWLLLMHLCRHLRKLARILVAAPAAGRRHVHALLLGLLDQHLPKLRTLLRRHARERALGRLLELLWRQVRHHLLVPLHHLIVRVALRGRPLIVAVHEVLVVLLLLLVLLAAAEDVVQKVHLSLLLLARPTIDHMWLAAPGASSGPHAMCHRPV